jgi:hypothetical protein
MKIQARDGEIDLSNPENVRKGMLFRVPMPDGPRDIVAACDGNFGVPAEAGRFLGCHPEIACESLLLLDTPPARRAKASFTIEHRSEALLRETLAWLKKAAPCTVCGQGVEFWACPMRWKVETLPFRPAERFEVELEEVAEERRSPATFAGIPFPDPIGSLIGKLGAAPNDLVVPREIVPIPLSSTEYNVFQEQRERLDDEISAALLGKSATTFALYIDGNKVFPTAEDAARGAVALLAWCCRLWDASPAGQFAARDVAVAKAIADVPEGCDPARWTNVVRACGAHSVERSEEAPEAAGAAEFADLFGWGIDIARAVLPTYAYERRVGWPRHVARSRALTGREGAELRAAVRAIAAYEAGR